MFNGVSRIDTPAYAGQEPDALVVLIVSADANMREAAARIAVREGYRAVTAAHAGHALLASVRGRIDVLAAELSLEEMSGPALAAKLRRHNPGLGTVYFGNAGTGECDGVLVRPFTSDDLVRALVAAHADAVCAPTFSVA